MRGPLRVKSEKTEAEQLEGKCRWHKKKTMKTKRNKPSTINNQPSTGLCELQSRSEQSSGNENPHTATPPEPDNLQATAPASANPDTTSGPQPAQPANGRPYVNFQERERNRQLPVDRVLAILRRWMPRQFELAEVVGTWIWITFPEQPAEQVRAELSQLGFHWNNTRKCWQHPCGQIKTEGSPEDPRVKYGSFRASAVRTPANPVAA